MFKFTRRSVAILLLLCWAISPSHAAQQPVANELAQPRVDESFFNGNDLTGWTGPAPQYWSVEDGAIVGKSDKPVPQNEFIWSPVEVRDFYLSVDVKLDPNEANAGIQFRSQKKPPHEALGYQADAGKGVWGRLYHESGRQKLDWRERGEAAVKPGEWNRYEILAVGHRVWTAINGKLAVSVNDPDGELSGFIALQIHAGEPLAARYRINRLVHNPKVELAGLDEKQLNGELVPTEDAPPKRFGEAPASPRTPRGPFPGGRFDLGDDEVVVFAGQTNMVMAQRTGDLEARLAAQFAGRRPRFRSMAWEGDTVYQQWRDLNFGGWRDQLTWAGATAVIAQFGQTEALDGPARIEAFIAAYGKLIDEWAATTRRIALVSPMPFEKPPTGSLMPDQSRRNDDVHMYAKAIETLASKRGLVYVDLFVPLAGRAGATVVFDPGPLTNNGMHLTHLGHRLVGQQIAKELGVSHRSDERLVALREAIAEKNRLWFDNWRPMNWAFAYGDRQQVPFGQPGGGRPALRIEFEEFKPLVAKADARIHELASQAQ